MMRLKSFVIVACLGGTASVAMADGSNKPFCFWIGGPLGLEYNIPNTPVSVGVGFAGVITNSTNQTTGQTGSIGLGPEIEVHYFTGPNNGGLGIGVRYGTYSDANSDSGSYISPNIGYFSRPKSSMAFHIGLGFPLGGDVGHIYPELGVGWQF